MREPSPQSEQASSRRGWNNPVLVLASVICLAALGIQAMSLCRPLLYHDDFDILAKSATWSDTLANLWVPVNEHSWPLTRLDACALIQLAGRPTLVPFATALQTRLVLVACMVLTYLFIRRERGHPFYGLAGMAVFGISAVYQEAVYWYAASPALLALGTALLALLAAQRWRQTGSWGYLALSALWAMLAPGWFAGGILAGPLCCLYLLSVNGRWASPVPFLGSLAFLAVSLPFAGKEILHAQHYGQKNALQAFDLTTGSINTGRALVDHLALGAVGIGELTCPPALAVVGVLLSAGVGVWWWRRAPARRLLILGLGFILVSYLLTYSARAAWSYETQLRYWSRYSVFPQLGVAFVLCGGLAGRRETTDRLSRREIWTLGWIVAILLVVQLPRGLIGTPYNLKQMVVLRRVEEVDALCRRHAIGAEDARAAVKKLPGLIGDDDAWILLRGSDHARPMSEDEVRQLLQP